MHIHTHFHPLVYSLNACNSEDSTAQSWEPGTAHLTQDPLLNSRNPTVWAITAATQGDRSQGWLLNSDTSTWNKDVLTTRLCSLQFWSNLICVHFFFSIIFRDQGSLKHWTHHINFEKIRTEIRNQATASRFLPSKGENITVSQPKISKRILHFQMFNF